MDRRNSNVKRFYQTLVDFHQISNEMLNCLRRGEVEQALTEFEKRGELLNEIQRKMGLLNDRRHLIDKDKLDPGMKRLLKEIMAIDKRCQELVREQMAIVSKSLSNVAKSRSAVGDFQTLSKTRRAPIVDFVY